MTRNLSIFNQLRPVTIGFDDVFNHFESMFDGDVFTAPTVNYPPYNIVRTGDNTYDIEVALAGFSKKDINVEYAENILTIKSVKSDESKESKDGAAAGAQQGEEEGDYKKYMTYFKKPKIPHEQDGNEC